MMFYHSFRFLNFDNIFVLHNGTLATIWEFVFKNYLTYYNNYLVDVLGVYQEELNDDLNIKNLKNQTNINNIKYEKLLEMQRFHYNKSQVEIKAN